MQVRVLSWAPETALDKCLTRFFFFHVRILSACRPRATRQHKAPGYIARQHEPHPQDPPRLHRIRFKNNPARALLLNVSASPPIQGSPDTRHIPASNRRKISPQSAPATSSCPHDAPPADIRERAAQPLDSPGSIRPDEGLPSHRSSPSTHQSDSLVRHHGQRAKATSFRPKMKPNPTGEKSRTRAPFRPK